MERRTVTLRQMELLVEFVEGHNDLALGRLRSKEGRSVSARLWRDCSLALNSEGPARTAKEWTKVWNDLKCRVKAKLTAAVQSRSSTGGGPLQSVNLSALEDRVADIIGRDIGPLPNVAQDPFLPTTSEGGEPIGTVEDVFVVEENVPDEQEQIELELATPGPSHAQPVSPHTMSPVVRSQRSTPRRLQRPRPRTTRTPRVRQPVQPNRIMLDESRAMVLRIEEMRARTDSMLAQAAVHQAEAAKIQAEAAKLKAEAAKLQAEAKIEQSRSQTAFYQAISSLVPTIKVFMERHMPRGERDED